MTSEVPRPGLYAPVVVSAALSALTPRPLIRRVVAEVQRPKHAHPTQIEDVGRLAASATASVSPHRGERAREAFVLGRSADERQRPISGRSATLAMVLASLGDLHGLAPSRVVIATGDLRLGSDAIHPVGKLGEKLEGIASWLRRRPGTDALVLFPGRLLPEADPHPEQLSDARWESLSRSLVEVGAELRPVMTLIEAAQLSFDGVDFAATAVGAIRAEIEQLRFARAYLPELVAACGRLLDEADALPSTAPLVPIARAEARFLARWAIQQMSPGEAATERVLWEREERSLATVLRQIDEDGQATSEEVERLAPELIAMRHNLDATDDLRQSLDFERGVAAAERGLMTPGLIGNHHSEHRRLLGTRGQLLWRAGLRQLAYGATTVARRSLKAALEDIERAHTAAQAEGVSDENDRARVRVYLAHALVAHATVDGYAPGILERIEREMSVALGCFFDPGEPRRPQQDPGWGLHALYRAWRIAGQPERVVTHWRSVSQMTHSDSGGLGMWEGWLGRKLISKRRQPYDAPIAAYVCECALAIGEVELAQATAALCPGPRNLHALARWWPAVQAAARDARGWPEGVIQIVTWARTGEPPLVLPGPCSDEFVGDLVSMLRARLGEWTPESRRAWRKLALWLGEPALGLT